LIIMGVYDVRLNKGLTVGAVACFYEQV
jgi:hypothetical protein